MPDRDGLTIGTAGHIDHGKTTLVKVLTGSSTDTLPEERRRGMSIELGFAELDLDGRRLSLVDVPGHERLVRTMIAGASGIGLFLMVIAADDGVMPQTLEHAVVLRSLGVDEGVVALTKCDVAGPDARRRAAADARDLFPRSPLVEVSSRTGEGIRELRGVLADVAAGVDADASRHRRGLPVLHVDRAFTAPGHGTVATGTLWSGAIEPGARLVLLPRGREVRVRAVQVHHRSVDVARASQRVALNVTRAGREQVQRGDALVDPLAAAFATYRLDVELLGPAAALGSAVRVLAHLGTRQATARLVPLGEGFAQLRLESQLIAQAGDRVVLRRLAPPEAFGGARVVDPVPRRHGPGPAVDRLRLIDDGPSLELVVAALEEAGAVPRAVERWAQVPLLAAARHRFTVDEWGRALQAALDGGAALEDGSGISAVPDSPPPAVESSQPDDPLVPGVIRELRKGGAMPPAPAEIARILGIEAPVVNETLAGLVRSGAAVRAKPDIYFDASHFAELAERVARLIGDRGSITIAEVRDAFGTSRKFAQALLEQLDAAKLTVRRGDVHVLRRRHVDAGRRRRRR
jgi:selenocysteine-specific elongation factor